MGFLVALLFFVQEWLSGFTVFLCPCLLLQLSGSSREYLEYLILQKLEILLIFLEFLQGLYLEFFICKNLE